MAGERRGALGQLRSVAWVVGRITEAAASAGGAVLADVSHTADQALRHVGEAGRGAAQTLTDLGPERGVRRVWHRSGHASIEVRGLTGHGPGHQRIADGVRAGLRGLTGVRWAEINAATAQVLVSFEEDQVDLDQLVDTVEQAEEAHRTASDEFSWQRPDPSDTAPKQAAQAALAADIAGVGVGLAGQIFRWPPLHPALRVPLAIAEGYPRARVFLEQRVGPVGADVLLAVGNAAMYGLSDGPGRPAVDAFYRLLQIGEAQARLETWSRRGLELSRRGVPGEVPRHHHRPGRLPAGPIERYYDQAAVGTLAASVGVLAATRDTGRTAAAILAGVPKAARLGREGFAAMLGRELARQGVLAMDPGALRRLDRVSAVIIDSAVMCGQRPVVLSADPAADSDQAALWRAARRVLRGMSASDLRGNGPWTAAGHRLTRAAGQGGIAPDGPQGLRLAVRTASGDVLGQVIVGCELDPLAEAVLGAARSCGERLLITRHASAQELVPRADEVVDGDLAGRVRDLSAAGAGVLLVAAADDEALAAADVAVSCVGDGRAGWTADLICGPGLTSLWRLLRAAGRARPVSERAVILSASGSALELLLATVGTRRSPGRSLATVGPTQAATLLSLIQGAYAGRSAALADPPYPVPRTAWHAMEPADVVARLDGARVNGSAGDHGLACEGQPSAPARRWPALLTASPVSAQLTGPLRAAGRLASSVVGELRDPLTPVLVIGAAASAVLGSPVDSALVGSVMGGNALVSGLQRMRTEQALAELLLAEQPEARRVRREPGGPVPEDPDRAQTDTVPASELRPGDLITLRADDIVPADARLVTAEALEVDESTLTGESMPVSKDPAATFTPHLAERSDMVYEGTTVLAGTALAVVVAIGDVTEAGRAAAAAAGAPRPAGVQARLGELTRLALPITGASGLAVTALGMLRGVPLAEALGAGVAMAVAAVPEGLPLVSTVAQLSAARRLSKQGVLVRSPRTLEALGRVDVLCFDKTGTLTEGRLGVTAAGSVDGEIDLDSSHGQRLLRIAARACPPPGGRQAHATDQAILEAAADRLGDDPGWELLDELPFQTNRGFSASLGRTGGRLWLAVKGSPEVMLNRCSKVSIGGSAGQDLSSQRRSDARSAVERLAAEGLRVLAVAERTVAQPAGSEALPGAERLAEELTLAGFLAIADVIRPDSPEIIKHLNYSGVRVLMITGDHPATASAIARNAGLPAADQVMTGEDLESLAKDERRARVGHCAVFARVSPEQKVRIVADLQRSGHVVAMTGDGTNDAAAIRLADVGIGVAARGSTAARSAADLILSGGDLSQIADALREGRALWRSVRDALSILLGGNAGEIAFMVAGTALGGRSPLNTRQLLLINMLTDMFPALAVALGERSQDDGLDDGPAGSLLGGSLARIIGIRGGATALGGTLAWAGGRVTGRARRASTMGLAAVIATQLGQTLLSNARSPVVFMTSVASAGALVLVVNTPGVSQFFGCTPLGPAAWGIVLASSATATLASAVAPRLRPASG